MDVRQHTIIHECKDGRNPNIHGCKDSKQTNIHGCKGGQVFHSLKMNKFYEPVQQNDFKGQLTNPGKLTYMDVRELTYMDRRRSDVPLLTNTRSKVKFQEPVHENELNIHDHQRLRMGQCCVYVIDVCSNSRSLCKKMALTRKCCKAQHQTKIIKIIR